MKNRINSPIELSLKNVFIAGNLIFNLSLLSTGFKIAKDIKNDIHHIHSKYRKNFSLEFGFKLKGWKYDLEENGIQLSHLVEILNKEKIERKFKLKSIFIEADNYSGESTLNQLEKITGQRYYGLYVPGDEEITIKSNSIWLEKTIHHEIKHDKFYDVKKENPNFLKQWKSYPKMNLDMICILIICILFPKKK